MKLVFVLLALSGCACAQSASARKPVHAPPMVTVSVSIWAHPGSEDLAHQAKRFLASEVRALAYVGIDDEDPDYDVSVIVAKVQLDNGREAGVLVSFAAAEAHGANPGRVKMHRALLLGRRKDLAEDCAWLVTELDTKVLQPHLLDVR
jgi:hypothetical protein